MCVTLIRIAVRLEKAKMTRVAEETCRSRTAAVLIDSNNAFMVSDLERPAGEPPTPHLTSIKKDFDHSLAVF
jgi:hypothetical protein